MGATVPSEVEGGSSQEKKSPDEKLEGDEPEDLQEESKCCSYGDLTAVSNPAACSIRLDSSSPLQALRNFARTPEKRVIIPKKEEEKKEEEEEKKVTVEVEMEENDINSNEEPEASDQTLDPSSDSTNTEVPMVRSCSLGEAKAREARSKVVVQYPVKKDHSEEEVVPDETDEDEVPDDTQNKPGHSNVESPIPKEQEYVYSSQADGDKRTRSEIPEQRKRMNLSKTDCENARPSSANRVEFRTPKEEKSCTSLTDAEDDEQETSTAEEPKEVPVQVVCKEGVTPVKQQKPDFKVGKLEECTKTASAYKQLGQALRANNFPGMPIPMQTLSQETYTKEVSQKGLLEKSQNPHWHGKKTDDLGLQVWLDSPDSLQRNKRSCRVKKIQQQDGKEEDRQERISRCWWDDVPERDFRSNMSMTDVIPAADIAKAIDAFKAADSFDHKKFFELLGLKKRSHDDVKKVFHMLDQDCSGFIEMDELKLMLQGFSKNGRALSDKEATRLLAAGDKDGDGKIGVDEFTTLVAEC